MCIGLGTVVGIASLVGAATTAVGTMSAASAQSSEANYRAQVARNNAIEAQQNRQYATQAGEAQAARVSLANAQQQGAIKAAEGASGVDVNSGSDVEVQKSTRELNELDTLTTMNNALLTAYGYNTQATSFKAQSQLDKFTAENFAVEGPLAATGSLLSNARSVANPFMTGSNPNTTNFDYGGGGSYSTFPPSG